MSIEKINQGDQLSQSADLVNDNIDKLKMLFPEIVTEGKIDFKVLQQVLGEELEEEEEYYRFTWAGKSQARREAHKPSTGTLRPAKEESLDWDTTQNMFCEGDNLEVLKLLQKTYSGKIRIIYIDPPYNTGNDFVYKDNYKDNLSNYKTITNQIDNEGNLLSTNSDSDGRFHSNWLNMMYPRLKLSRNLLKNNGLFFLNIGEEEVHNVEKIMNEVFGESNKVSLITRVSKTASNKGTHFAPSVDYILCYAKDIDNLNPFKDKVDESLYKKVEVEGTMKGEKYRDDIAFYQSSLDPMRGCVNQRYFIEAPDGTLLLPPGDIFPSIKKDGEHVPPKTKKDKVWRWSYPTYNEKKHLLVFKKTKKSPLIKTDGTRADYNIYTKSYLVERQEKGTLPRNLFTNFINRKGADLIKKYGISFDFSKPIELIQYLCDIIGAEKNDIILDFFSGSCSTAHGVFEKNIEKELNLKYIMVQIPEPIDKNEFNTVAEIGKERIRRVVQKIKEENPEKSKEMDLGFKVFKLDSSNIKSWDENPENLETSLFDAVGNIKTDRTEEDVLYEILLKYGLDLTLPIEERIIEGKKVFNVGLGSLFICLSDDITAKVAEGIGQWKEACSPEICRVIFKDNGFTDVEKTNSVQTLKRYGIKQIRSI